MRYSLRYCFYLAFLLLAALPCYSSESANMALGKKYSIFPSPNYHLCTDPGDRTQLTDGKTTTSYFWTQKGTVGWQYSSYVDIVIDLGKTEPVDRVTFTSAAGKAGVQWPRTAMVLVSDDGKNFYKVGDLIAADEKRNGLFDNETYAIRKIESDPLAVKGRYVKLFLIGSGPFLFIDEIEVFRGAEDLLQKKMTGETFSSSKDLAARIRSESAFRIRYEKDAKNIDDMIDFAFEQKLISEKDRGNFKSKVGQIRRELLDLSIPDVQTFKAVLPYNKSHQKLLAVQADLWRKKADRQLCVNANNCWEPIDLVGRWPEKGPAQGQLVDLLLNENRYFTYLLYNSSTDPLEVSVSVHGKNFPARNMKISEVLWTDTNSMIPVACAISPLPYEKTTSAVKVTVLPGLVKQLWFSITSEGLSQGAYDLDLNFETKKETRNTKILLTVHPLEMPKNATLMTGGWDYTADKGHYSVTPLNRDNFIKICKEHRVNAPWAQNSVLLDCKRDPITKKPVINMDLMEEWLAQWKGAREYFVFLSIGGTFLDSKINTPEFEAGVAEWSRLWSNWLRQKGYDPKKFNLLLVDEPGIESQLNKIANIYGWSKALKKASSEFRVWEDPVFTSPQKMPAELAACSDVLCPNRPQWLNDPEHFDKFYNDQRNKGKVLNLYSCSGPVRLYDAYHYYLLQAWHCFQIDAKASFFWALGDGSGQSSWNEYLLGRSSFTPLFIDPNDENILPGKMIKAMQIGVQDYEVLLALKNEIKKYEKDPSKKDRVEQAKNVLNKGVEKVLKNCSFESLTDRKISMDRDLSDIVRREVIHWIFVLRHP